MYFWFQPLAGIHTSMPMLESAVGVAVITTRQNARHGGKGGGGQDTPGPVP